MIVKFSFRSEYHSSLAGPLITTHQSASRPPASTILGAVRGGELQNSVDIDIGPGSFLSLLSHTLWWQWLPRCLVGSSEESHHHLVMEWRLQLQHTTLEHCPASLSVPHFLLTISLLIPMAVFYFNLFIFSVF